MAKYTDDISSNYPNNPRKGKDTFMPGKPKKKAYQYPIDESSPPIVVKKTQQYMNQKNKEQ